MDCALKYHFNVGESQWRTEGGFGGFKPGGGGFKPPPEIPKLSQIPRSVENKSVTT
jgi:hypothetical protein